MADLGLPVVGDAEAVLADGSEAVFDVYGVTMLWDGQPRYVETGAVGVDPSWVWRCSTATACTRRLRTAAASSSEPGSSRPAERSARLLSPGRPHDPFGNGGTR